MPKTALIILDGFGVSRNPEGNAILQANTPFLDNIIDTYPKALLHASSQEVGLPWGEFGNSEVGHTNIGLGRVVLQNLPQIDKSFESGQFTRKTQYSEISAKLSKGANLHIIGMCSDGAVHGHYRHIDYLAQIFNNISGIGKIFIHLISDGRDSPEKSFEKYFTEIEKDLSAKIRIGSVSGRYYAMDRDKNWDRIRLAYENITGISKSFEDSVETIVKNSYTNSETDEYFVPKSISGLECDVENDVFIFTNYRADRAIQLTRAFVDEKFEEFSRQKIARNFYTMTTYDDNLSATPLYSNLDLNDPETNSLLKPLPEIISLNGLRQFHVSETEKFAHITYFFSGGIKDPYEGQENRLIDSAKVKSHDLYPQMRANEISDCIIQGISKNNDFIIANYANGDMVGHSGNLEATIMAVETIDYSLKKITPALLNADYNMIITSDHGNCDEMIDAKSKKINKEHTLNPVPFILINKKNKGSQTTKNDFFSSDPIGLISDISPTILDLMEIEQPSEMTGVSLVNSLV